MAVWTPELKEQVIKMYKEAEPTAETSTEIIKDIADTLDQSPNGVRQVLILAGEYVKKDPAASSAGKTSSAKSSAGEGSKRVSKESQIDALKQAIEAAGHKVDEDIVSKLTGKAAAYFASILGK